MAAAGYDEPQVRNAAIIADVAHGMGLGDRGALLGVMCAMGESSLRNIDYGDWETNGVRNPDGSPTSSIGLFQQQRWWGTPAERMDARHAAGAFFAALVRVRDWATLPPTLAIHRAQINADPNHYSRYEQPACAVLAHIADRRAKGGGLFMAAPVIEWVRDGVGFTPDAAASFRRAEAKWGRIPCNSTYRDWGLQLSMWQAWEAWTQGRGPKPNHSRAVHPDQSRHTSGIALDTDLWTVAGFIAFMVDHGWIRTAAWDPTEQHHFEYQWWRDNHRNDPAPAGQKEEEDMNSEQDEMLRSIFIAISDKANGIQHNANEAAGAAVRGEELAKGTQATAKNVESILADVRNAIADPKIGVLVASNEARASSAAALSAVGKLSLGGGKIDVDALAKSIRKDLGADLATELAKRLAN
ncbi:hypothetical protein [Microbacterium sp. Leaf436]|uniref:hypothetical protein n=1 Tax=Microbacterium sp. Leaf436 TaxID=1736377 RepID=UPI0006F514E4|nr:hypothetical protein [Microbacterium sp. Leaf436]KQT75411.1 hypothetical protein ASG45_02610 [Microbacterium sp. Leaf436]